MKPSEAIKRLVELLSNDEQNSALLAAIDHDAEIESVVYDAIADRLTFNEKFAKDGG
jgi:hypothetical protein